MKNRSLFMVLNDLDSFSSNLEVSLDTFGLILESLDSEAAKAERDEDAERRFLSRYEFFSRMLFLILGQIQRANKTAGDLICEAFEAERKEARHEVV